METVVVARESAAFLDYVLEKGIVDTNKESVRVTRYIEPDEAWGKRIVSLGYPSLRVASVALYVTCVPIDLPENMRHRSLTLDEIKAHAKRPRTFMAKEISSKK